LSRAAEKGDKRIVKLLLEKGALPDFEDRYGWTPLLRAVESGSVAVIKLLLAKKVKMDYVNLVSEEPIYISMGLY
jgi:ankyrin repeat protein